MKYFAIFIGILFGFSSFAQVDGTLSKLTELNLVKDTIYIEQISISPFHFKILDADKKLIPKKDYQVDFAKAELIINSKKYTYIYVFYDLLPDFLTKTYQRFDSKLIVPDDSDLSKAYRLTQAKKVNNFKPFEGLNSSGSLSRTINIGTNQNAGLASNFDLQLSGKLSKDLSLRASISDNNIALQQGAFSQRLNEFDNVFIELFTDTWRIKAGDIDLTNSDTHFLKFDKKVSGMALNAMINKGKSSIQTSGAVVKGQFAQFKFTGLEGNQGPYRITGPSGQPFVLIVAGSERVFVNGISLKRGENNDYVMDYGAAQLTFNTTYPINANMRIVVEYQFTDRNYTRFVTYDSYRFSADKLSFESYFYNENDAKNQPVQLNISPAQQAILAQSGDLQTNMVVPSAVPAVYDVNKVLYKKTDLNGQAIFEVSNNPLDSLFEVTFSFVGNHQGDYILTKSTTNGRVFEYIAPLNSIKQGDYSPVRPLIAPEKLQVAVLKTSYNPNKKSKIVSEFAFSNIDKNLFSSLQDGDNKGLATKILYDQIWIDKKWQLSTKLNYEFNSTNFKSVERYQNVEFARDWNLISANGKQNLIDFGTSLSNKNTRFNYQFQQLKFSTQFKGTKHHLESQFNFKNFETQFETSYLSSESNSQKGDFFKWYSNAIKRFNKVYTSLKISIESNNQKDFITNKRSPLSHQFKDIGLTWGLGDSTKVFIKLGMTYRITDSLHNEKMQKVSTSKTYFIDSRLIKNNKANLSLYTNYRTVANQFFADEVSLNARLVYAQKLFNDGLNLNTVYETSSGSLAQQAFTYIQVDNGQGFYTWNDYNDNGIQELNEFEVAVFKDQANYVRLFLPNINFLKTNLNKFSQSLLVNPSSWQKGVKNWLSHFVNQSFILIENNKLKSGNSFNLNPFDISNVDVIGLQFSLRNSLYFNRGLQHYSTTYTFTKAKNNTNLITGSQQNFNQIHNLLLVHKLSQNWVLDFQSEIGKNHNESVSFVNRNYQLNETKVFPKLKYLYNKNTTFEVNYTFENLKNKLSGSESLITHNFGMQWQYNGKQKLSAQSAFNILNNNFKGNSNSPVAYQMLKGLQPGTNVTWSAILQKQLSNSLDFNLSYFGRKSINSKAIHAGSVQLKVNF